MHFHQLITDNIEDAQHSCIALLGGGGKTAVLHTLANEFAQFYPKVLQTSLTKTAFPLSEKPIFISDFIVNGKISIKQIGNPLFLIGEKISNDKLLGISETDLKDIRHQFNISIFECDGARNLPLKVHTEYDPRVPNFATHTIIIVGADVVNTKIDDGLVHRPELFCKTWNVSPDLKLDVEFIAKVATSYRGYLSKVPNEMNIIYFINKWDRHSNNAEILAKVIFNKSGKPTYYGSVQQNVIRKVID